MLRFLGGPVFADVRFLDGSVYNSTYSPRK